MFPTTINFPILPIPRSSRLGVAAGTQHRERQHNLVAFRQAWKRFEEAVPGSVRLVPQAELRKVIEQDYRAMQGLILGEAPDFGWVMDQLRQAEVAINGT